MLIDYISVEKLPGWLVWLDWCFYTYNNELFWFLTGAIFIWLIYCFVQQGGFAVG
jgi:hypothetical protein